MKFEDLIIKTLKDLVPKHELAHLLHSWFKRSEDEIINVLQKHEIHPSEIHDSLVKIGLREAMEVDHKTMTVLVDRLKSNGIERIHLTEILRKAGFMESELKTLEIEVSKAQSEVNKGVLTLLDYPSKTGQK